MTIEARKESRWSRPNLYATIVGIYLLALTSLMVYSIGYFGYLAYDQRINPENYCGMRGCSPNFLIFIAATVILTIPTIISARGARRLLKLRYNGFRDALISLIFCTIALVFLSRGGLAVWSLSDPLIIPLIVSVILTSIMYAFLMVGRKTTQWRTN